MHIGDPEAGRRLQAGGSPDGAPKEAPGRHRNLRKKQRQEVPRRPRLNRRRARLRPVEILFETWGAVVGQCGWWSRSDQKGHGIQKGHRDQENYCDQYENWRPQQEDVNSPGHVE